MGRLLIALEPVNEVSPVALATAWNADAEARVLGTAQTEGSRKREFLPGALELIVIPLLVNVTSSAVYDLIKKLVRRLHPAPAEELSLELAEMTTKDGDRVVTVRFRKGSP